MPELSALQLIIGFLLLLTPVVFFHELGHYWVARRAGVKPVDIDRNALQSRLVTDGAFIGDKKV